MGDGGVMQALHRVVIHTRNPDGLGNVPVGRREGQLTDGIAGPIEQGDLRAVTKTDRHISPGRTGQHHLIIHMFQSGDVARLVHNLSVGIGHHQNIGGVIVDHPNGHGRNAHAVVFATVTGVAALGRGMADGDPAFPFGQDIVTGRDDDFLGNEPVGPVKQQGHALGAALDTAFRTEQNALTTGPLFGFPGQGRGGGDDHAFQGRPGQNHPVFGEGQARPEITRRQVLLEHGQMVGRGIDTNPGLVVVRHIGRHVHDGYTPVDVGCGDIVNDDPAVTLVIVADHGNGLTVGASGHVEGVAAPAAHQHGVNVLAGTGHKEGVIALHGVDDHLLHTGVGDKSPGAVNALGGDHEIIAVFGADDGQGVQTVPAIDAHRRIDHIGNEIRTLTAVDVGVGSHGIIGVHGHETHDPEGVVVLFAVQVEFGHVAVHGEPVVTRTAVNAHGVADAPAQIAPGGQDGGEPVVFGKTRVFIPWGFEQLADLEHVVAVVPVDRHGRAVVVKDKGVIPVTAVHPDGAVDVCGVIDALDGPGRQGMALVIHRHGGDHGRAEQKGFRRVGAVDVHGIHTGIQERRLVVHIDQGRAVTGKTDHIVVAPRPTPEGQDVAQAVFKGLIAHFVNIDPEGVAARTAVQNQGTGGLIQVDRVVPVAGQNQGGCGRGLGHVKGVGGLAQHQGQAFDSGIGQGAAHAEAGQALVRQGADLIGAAVGPVVDDQVVGPRAGVDGKAVEHL
ncbi:hypothetical protein [Desulfatiferula olefinivorans]